MIKAGFLFVAGVFIALVLPVPLLFLTAAFLIGRTLRAARTC